MSDTILGWHFAQNDMRLGYDDEREIRDGETLHHDGELVMCKSGLHYSERIINALHYSRGHMICRVEGPADALVESDKRCGAWRKCLWHIDGEELLRDFARWCALQVIDKWDAPDVVRKYLETGDESLRYAAWYAAGAVTEAAAGVAAGAAAGAAAGYAARAGARNAARFAAWDAAGYVAGYDARDAAVAAARAVQNTKLERMVMEAKHE